MRKQLAFSLIIAITIGLVATQPASAAPVDEKFGYDVSWPQCGQILPSDGSFKIVGVNDGRPFYQNPCLTEQISWAATEAVQLYLNTANPGPELSSFWPTGQLEPKVCSEANPDTSDCAYNYGYNYAAKAMEMATSSFQALGSTLNLEETWIWLDVEEENTWRLEYPSLNVASIKGAVYYLEKVAGAQKIGFYSVNSHWKTITGNTKIFSDYPSWLATASNAALSIERCMDKVGFTGGKLLLTQYIDPDLNLDVNVNCLDAPKLATVFSGLRPKEASSTKQLTFRAKLVAETGNPVTDKKVTFRFRGKNYQAKTNPNGVAKINLTAPKVKREYTLSVTFAGAKYYDSAKVVSKVRVN